MQTSACECYQLGCKVDLWIDGPLDRGERGYTSMFQIATIETEAARRNEGVSVCEGQSERKYACMSVTECYPGSLRKNAREDLEALMQCFLLCHWGCYLGLRKLK